MLNNEIPRIFKAVAKEDCIVLFVKQKVFQECVNFSKVSKLINKYKDEKYEN
jgi:hypothetical protein